MIWSCERAAYIGLVQLIPINFSICRCTRSNGSLSETAGFGGLATSTYTNLPTPTCILHMQSCVVLLHSRCEGRVHLVISAVGGDASAALQLIVAGKSRVSAAQQTWLASSVNHRPYWRFTASITGSGIAVACAARCSPCVAALCWPPGQPLQHLPAPAWLAALLGIPLVEPAALCNWQAGMIRKKASASWEGQPLLPPHRFILLRRVITESILISPLRQLRLNSSSKRLLINSSSACAR